MRSTQERKLVAELLEAGLNDCQIARDTGIPRETVRDWRVQPQPRGWPRRPSDTCIEDLPAAPYAYLLGMYLGDGYLAPTVRGSRQLRIYLDNRYPSIILECALAIEHLFPGRRAGLHHHATYNMILVTLYSRYWEELLPQHGPGMKHTRTIRLAEWQRALVAQEPISVARRDSVAILDQFIGPKR